jgi:hypothetical protein
VTRPRSLALTVLAPVAAVVLLATSALATTTIPIKSSQVPVQASAFGEHSDCSFPELPSRTPPLYGWHFVLPGGTATFVSLTAHFTTAGDVTIPGPAGGFVQDGKGAVIYTATDDTLTGATATIEGTTPQDEFVLSHTCLPAASQTPTPSGTPSETPSGTPSESVSATASTSETPSAEVSGTKLSQSPSESGSVSPTVLGVKETKGGVAGTGLPTTGLSVLGLLVLVAGLLLVGVPFATTPKGRYAR